jgi:hypothetical protein
MPDAEGRIPPVYFSKAPPWQEDPEEMEAQRQSLAEWEGTDEESEDQRDS